MGRQHHLVQPDQCLWRRGLTLVHIQPGPCNTPFTQCVGQCGGVHHTAPPDVDQKPLGAQRRQHRRIHQVARGRPARCGHHQKVGPLGQRQHRVEIAVSHIVALAAVVVPHSHVKTQRTPGNLQANGAHTHNAQPPVRHLRRQRQRVAPDAVAAGAVVAWNGAHRRQQQPQRMVGHTVLVGARTVGHHDAARLGVAAVDVLEPGPQGTHQLQAGHGVHLLRRQAH